MTTHLMLDIESLGTRVGSIVLAAAFVRFTDEQYCSVNLSIPEQTALGMTWDQSTIDWWRDQSAKALAAGLPDPYILATQNPIALSGALQYLATWVAWAGPDPLIWCHGAGFDAPLLEEAFRRAGISCPWKFWSVRDTRTLYDLAGVDKETFAVSPPHVALNDAIGQTRAANASLRVLAGVRGLVPA